MSGAGRILRGGAWGLLGVLGSVRAAAPAMRVRNFQTTWLQQGAGAFPRQPLMVAPQPPGRW
eukprot:9153650-Alexandrium_andersonii.AAC.1